MCAEQKLALTSVRSWIVPFLLLKWSFHPIHLARNCVCTVLRAADFSLFCCLFPSVLECSGTGKRGCVSSQVINHIFSSPTIMLHAVNKSMVKYSSNFPLMTLEDITQTKASANSLHWWEMNQMKFSFLWQAGSRDGESSYVLKSWFQESECPVLLSLNGKMPPIGSSIWTLGPQWVSLFEGGSTSQEVDFKCPWPYPSFNLSFCFVFVVENVILQFPASATCCHGSPP